MQVRKTCDMAYLWRDGEIGIGGNPVKLARGAFEDAARRESRATLSPWLCMAAKQLVKAARHIVLSVANTYFPEVGIVH